MTDVTSVSPLATADTYSEQFFEKMDLEARSSARVVVPLVVDLLQPASLLDVGCGRGVWLSVFRDYDVERINGIDGPWVEQSKLAVPAECFRVADLNSEQFAGERFDLAVCLEVAEHLPRNSSSEFVASLVRAAPAVLFSAAIPGQEGTNHVNEQWPDYWEQLFAEHSYVRLDPFRRLIWQDARVAWYYQQNLYLYVARSLLDDSEKLQNEFERTRDCQLTLVHPKALRPIKQFRPALRLLPQLLLEALRRRSRRKSG